MSYGRRFWVENYVKTVFSGNLMRTFCGKFLIRFYSATEEIKKLLSDKFKN